MRGLCQVNNTWLEPTYYIYPCLQRSTEVIWEIKTFVVMTFWLSDMTSESHLTPVTFDPQTFDF